MNTQFATNTNLNSTATAFPSETARFREIVKKYIHAGFRDRPAFFKEVSKYIQFSPDSFELIHELILYSTFAEEVEDRLDAAVDILHQFPKICDYAREFLSRDVDNYNKTYTARAYEPNDDYWHILLKSVASSDTNVGVRLSIINGCRNKASRAIKEIVIESLDAIDHPDALDLIQVFTSDSDSMIRELAIEILEN